MARDLIAQNKRDRAKLALRKKKMQENQIDKLDSWLLNVEGMVSPLPHNLKLLLCRLRN